MAVNFAALNQVYSHYMANYAPKSSTPLDSHKKSELRGIYNSIVKLNKDAPLYLLNHSDEVKAYAIGLKENARELHNTIMSMGSLEDDSLLSKKVAYSTNNNLITATFVGTSPPTDDSLELSVQVKSLAEPQTNMGNFLSSDSKCSLPADAYSMDITIHDISYEFQFNINENDTNKDVQDRLSRLITNSGIGITAETIEDVKGNSSLKLTSNTSGLEEGKNSIFRVDDAYSSKSGGVVDYLGIGDITRNASNAEFVVNDIERSTNSNHFIIENTYEVTLKGISKDENDIAVIGIKNDNESLKENIRTLVGGYNNFIKSANEYTQASTRNRQLVREMGQISSIYAERFETLGIDVSEDGFLKINEDTLEHASVDENYMDRFSPVKDFTTTILKKTNDISLNPMNYVERTVVAYKNIQANNFPSPYVTSEYSGLLFNSYC